jgi:preprotein translocase subunit SecF
MTVIGAGLFSIFKWGYKYSIDFVGGTNLEYQLDKAIAIDSVKTIIQKEKIELKEIESKDKVMLARTSPIDETIEKKLKENLEKNLKVKITVLKSETVGPTLGREMVTKTIIASVLAIIGILIYMSFAFKSFNFALSAILAGIHDFLVVVGSYSLMSHFWGAQFDIMFVTAILTTMSFSLHDTIVIFDKIREYRTSEGGADINYFANKALTETMVRSLNNSMTIFFMLLALVILGGSTIKFFVAALLVGTVTGTYSSPFVATPILVFLEKRRKK